MIIQAPFYLVLLFSFSLLEGVAGLGSGLLKVFSHLCVHSLICTV